MRLFGVHVLRLPSCRAPQAVVLVRRIDVVLVLEIDVVPLRTVTVECSMYSM